MNFLGIIIYYTNQYGKIDKIKIENKLMTKTKFIKCQDCHYTGN